MSSWTLYRAALTYSAMHEQEGTIQLFAAVKFPFLGILLQQIAESYLPAHASLSKLTYLLTTQASCSVDQLKVPKYLDIARWSNNSAIATLTREAALVVIELRRQTAWAYTTRHVTSIVCHFGIGLCEPSFNYSSTLSSIESSTRLISEVAIMVQNKRTPGSSVRFEMSQNDAKMLKKILVKRSFTASPRDESSRIF